MTDLQTVLTTASEVSLSLGDRLLSLHRQRASGRCCWRRWPRNSSSPPLARLA